MTFISNKKTVEGKTKGFNAVSTTNFVLVYSQEAQQSLHLVQQVKLSLK